MFRGESVLVSILDTFYHFFEEFYETKLYTAKRINI